MWLCCSSHQDVEPVFPSPWIKLILNSVMWWKYCEFQSPSHKRPCCFSLRLLGKPPCETAAWHGWSVYTAYCIYNSIQTVYLGGSHTVYMKAADTNCHKSEWCPFRPADPPSQMQLQKEPWWNLQRNAPANPQNSEKASVILSLILGWFSTQQRLNDRMD